MAAGLWIKRIRRLGLLVCCALLAALPAPAETAEPSAWPALSEEGFLETGEFVYEGAGEGLWRYCSDSLRIEIVRKQQIEPKKLIWYEADIYTRGGEGWQIVTAEPGRHLAYGIWPSLIAQRHRVVFGINNDYAQGRYPSKNRSVGLIIREGKVLWEKTRTKAVNNFPNLDVMAFMPDGSLQVFDFNEHTAEEYLEMGIRDIQCFGPWMIRDGELRSDTLNKIGRSINPRTAIGMVENGHYVAVVVEGRYKESKGVSLRELADIMLKKGCTVAFNLDGGTTSAMVFVGLQINTVGGSKNPNGSARRVTELISVGTSERVRAEE